MDRETALQRFPEDQTNIEANELRWHPPAARPTPTQSRGTYQNKQERKSNIVFLCVVLTIVAVIAIVVFGGSSTSTTPTPPTPIPAEQHHITPSEEQAIEQNERESKAGNPQSHAIEREVQEEKANAHKFAEELEKR
jgi:hypothetical protein